MCLIYIISVLYSNFLFSLFTVFLIDGNGDDSPVILVGMFLICGVLSMFTAIISPFIEWKFEEKYQREISIENSASAFLILYLPFLLATSLQNIIDVHFLEIPIAILLFVSYIPFCYTTAKSFISLYEWLKESFIR